MPLSTHQHPIAPTPSVVCRHLAAGVQDPFVLPRLRAKQQEASQHYSLDLGVAQGT